MDEIKRALLGDEKAQKAITEREELLPCPFCGGEAVLFEEYKLYGIRCKDECCIGYDVSAQYGNEKFAIEDYNLRPQILTDDELERLEGKK